MPRYTSKKKRNQKRERRRVRHAVPRDKRHLMHWAVRGNHDDYARFRKHIGKIADRAPSYVSQDAMSALKQTDRRQMLAALGKEPFGGSWFTDGPSWAIDQVPNDLLSIIKPIFNTEPMFTFAYRPLSTALLKLGSAIFERDIEGLKAFTFVHGLALILFGAILLLTVLYNRLLGQRVFYGD